jgi:hypothetical protein
VEYSESKDSVFCYYCRLAKIEKVYGSIGIGFKFWKNARVAFNMHEQSEEHRDAMNDLFKRIEQDKNNTSINKQLGTLRQQEVEKNREYLIQIVKTVKFCAKQNIPFRGHDESTESLNRGNFLELIEFRKEDVKILNETVRTSYSAMKIIKTYLRNSMGQSRLSDLAIIYIEKEITKLLSCEKVVEQFAASKGLNRKMSFY